MLSSSCRPTAEVWQEARSCGHPMLQVRTSPSYQVRNRVLTQDYLTVYHKGFIIALSLAAFGLAGAVFQHVLYRVSRRKFAGQTAEERSPTVLEKFVL